MLDARRGVRMAMWSVAAIVTLVTSSPAEARAQFAACELLDPTCIPPEPSREFRGVWVASVDNIDWPSRPGLSTAAAKAELIKLLDRSKAMGLNAVVFQVRPAGDALYASKLEPWSEYLTGKQGVAPKPAWDPLAFAVSAAHERGLELHAWFNPYRARHPSAKGALARSHMANARPALVKKYGTHLWMDPGEDAVREHTIKVIVDVVRRYDIDGVHIDDYFYPYKERERGSTEFPDSASFARYVSGGGTLARNDWRRENVNRLVKALYDSIHAAKPSVKFGISPFGIWQPGYPWQIRGFNAYSELYADARLWIREGWVDYFTPQLYWPVMQVPQAYPVLLRWWSQQNLHGRHMWPGNYASKVGEQSRTAWLTPEIEQQIAVTRREAGASGNIHFSMKVFLEDRDAISSRLARGPYAEPALVPASPWLAVETQGAPRLGVVASRGTPRAGGARSVQVAPSAGSASPRFWFVQERITDGTWRSSIRPGTARTLTVPTDVDRVAVRAVDHAGVAGPIAVVRATPREVR